MSGSRKLLWIGVGTLAVMTICCLGVVVGMGLVNQNQETPARTNPVLQVEDALPAVDEPAGDTSTDDSPATDPPPPPAPTLAPTLAPQPSPIAPNQEAAEFQEMTQYGQALQPILEQAGSAAERDSAILQAAENNPGALCQGSGTPHQTLVQDAALMHNLEAQLKRMSAPEAMSQPVHTPLTDSARLWGEALDNINQSCMANTDAERDLLRLGAVLQLGGSLINFHVASDNFWRLAVVNGLEAIGGQPATP